MQRLAWLGLRICSGAQDVAPALDAAQDWSLLAVSGQADRTAVTSVVHTVVGLSVLLADLMMRRLPGSSTAEVGHGSVIKFARDNVRLCLRVWLCVRACV